MLTRNRLRWLRACLAALRPQLQAGDEIVVLDTGSTDGTHQYLDEEQRHGLLRWTTTDATALDFAAARNRLVQEATAEVVAFMDDDCEPQPGWAKALRGAFASAAVAAAGGPVDPGPELKLPEWWEPGLAWTVGLSGPEFEVGRGIPSTSNLAIRRSVALAHPFSETSASLDGANRYLGGREDADWVVQARLRGDTVTVVPAARVWHHFPPERLQVDYVLNRAETDGRAAWRRQGSLHSLRVAGAEASRAWVRRKLVRHPCSLADRAWETRQWGLWREGQSSPQRGGPGWTWLATNAFGALRQQALSACIQARKRVTIAVGAAPAAVPAARRASRPTILVLAPTYLGDTVLLRPAMQRLALARPEARIVWATQWPSLAQLGLPNVEIVNLRAAGDGYAQLPGPEELEICVVPYFHAGRVAEWRRYAPVAATFDRDVGFARQREYAWAARTVHKHGLVHEIEQLGQLLALAHSGIDGPLVRVPLTPDPELSPELTAALSPLEQRRPILVFMRTGLRHKDWPHEFWIEAVRGLADLGHAVAVAATPDEPHAAAHAAAVVDHPGVISLPVCRDDGELATLVAQARVVVAGCSGPKHLAHAVGCPTVTLYGRTEPERWGAYFPEDQHLAIVSSANDLDERDVAELPIDHSMRLIRPSRVVSEVDDFLRSLA